MFDLIHHEVYNIFVRINVFFLLALPLVSSLLLRGAARQRWLASGFAAIWLTTATLSHLILLLHLWQNITVCCCTLPSLHPNGLFLRITAPTFLSHFALSSSCAAPTPSSLTFLHIHSAKWLLIEEFVVLRSRQFYVIHRKFYISFAMSAEHLFSPMSF